MNDEAWDYACAGLTWSKPEKGVLNEAGKKEVLERLADGSKFPERKSIKQANKGWPVPSLTLFRYANVCFLVQTELDKDPPLTQKGVGDYLKKLSIDYIRDQQIHSFLNNSFEAFDVGMKKRRRPATVTLPRTSLNRLIEQIRPATPIDKARWVRIKATPEKGEPKTGTGFVIGPGKVITAQWLIKSAVRVNVRVNDRQDPLPAKPKWPKLNDIDSSPGVAVLDVVDLPGPDPWSLFSPLSFPAGAHWEVQAWEGEPVKGQLTIPAVGTSPIRLNTDTSGADGSAMAGAPVLVWGRLVGIVDGQADTFEAIPVAAMLSKPGFRDAVGLDDRDRRLVWMRDNVAKELDQHPSFKEMLGGEYMPPEQLADVLFQIGARKLMEQLQGVAKLMTKAGVSRADGCPVRRVMEWVLPWCVDWSGAVKELESRLKTGPEAKQANWVHVTLETATLAEIVTAHAHRRPCFYDDKFARHTTPMGKRAIVMGDEIGIEMEGTEVRDGILRRLGHSVGATIDSNKPVDDEVAKIVDERLAAKKSDLLAWDPEGPFDPPDSPHYVVFMKEARTERVHKDLPNLTTIQLHSRSDVIKGGEQRYVMSIATVILESQNQPTEK